VRNAAAQLKAAEALAVLAARSGENRKAITAAQAVGPLVRLLGDGRRVRAETPQERAAAVLADLAKLGENKVAIVKAGGVPPLVAMLSSDAQQAQTNAAASLWHIAMVGSNKGIVTEAGAIAPLVQLLASGAPEARKFSTGAMWHMCSAGDNKTAMVAAGAIAPLVAALQVDFPRETSEFAAAVLCELARTQGGVKKAIAAAGGIPPLIDLLMDPSISTQRYAACALWGLSEGKEGVYDKQIVEAGGVPPLIRMLMANHEETRGFAAKCLLCLCADDVSRQAILDAGGADPWLSMAGNSSTWLRAQAIEMLTLLGIPYQELDQFSPRPGSPGRGGGGSAAGHPPAVVPLIAQKGLPIREHSSIDVEKENARVGDLAKGEAVFVLERKEIGSVLRALISSEPRGPPRGWVTAGKEGVDFLMTEAAAYAASLATAPNHEKMKYHFFSFQLPENSPCRRANTTGYQGFT